MACGVAGPVLFVVAFLVEGATRPDYDAVRHPVSALSIGPPGWSQATNFVVTGLLILAYAIGLRLASRRPGGGIAAPLLVGLVGLGLIGAGFFVTDPISGYPPGTVPMVPAESRSWHGVAHDLCSTPVFTALPVACFVLAYRFGRIGRRGWMLASVLVGVVFLVCFVMTSLGFAQTAGFVSVGGLLQRVTLIIGFGWLAVVAAFLLRHGREPSRSDVSV